MYLNHINYFSEVSDMYHNIREVAERFGVAPSTIWLCSVNYLVRFSVN